MRIVTIQTDFTSGELSPRLLARVDLEAYRHGVKTMSNAYPLPHGGARRRPGTYFIDEVYNSAQEALLIPFTFSRSAAYIIVVNGGRMEFIKDGQFITTGSPATHYGISCPYTEADLPEVRYAQIGATMYFAHPDYAPRVLTRSSDTSWTLAEVSFDYRAVSDYWFENAYIKFKILNGTTTFVVGDSFSISSGGVVTPGANTGNGIVYGVTFLDTAATHTLECVYADANRQEWDVLRSGVVHAAKFKTGNYPAAVTVHEQRLYWAGTPAQPQTLFGSAIGNYTDLTLGGNPNDGVQFTIASNSYDQILHLEPTRQLIPLSYGGEFSVIGGDSLGITPSTVRISAQTFHGSSLVKPIRIGQEILFVQRGNKKVRAISYSVTEDVNLAPDITILAEHITGDGIKDSTFAQDPDYTAWFTLDDGSLISLTHLRDFNVTGWAKHSTTNGSFEWIATIPEGQTDVTYVSVKRTINGATKRYIEYIEYADDVYSDCSVIGAGVASATWSGLDHLEGETVTVIADGNVHPDCVVTSGQVTLDYAASDVIIGLPYTSTIEMLHPDLALANGTSQGRGVNVYEATVRIQDTVGLVIDDMEQYFRIFGGAMDSAPAPRTGDMMIKISGWSTNRSLKLEQRIPKPWTILGVILKVAAND